MNNKPWSFLSSSTREVKSSTHGAKEGKLQNLFENGKWKLPFFLFFFISYLIISLHVVLIPRSIEGSKQFRVPLTSGTGPCVKNPDPGEPATC